MEIRFKPADVGTVPDGSVTNVKVNVAAAIDQSKINNLTTDLDKKINDKAVTATKKVNAIGYDDGTEELVYDIED